MADETQAAAETKMRWGAMMGWVGGATALIGLFGSLAGGAGWIATHHRDSAERKAQMAVAQGMVSQGEYEEAVKSYGEILKGDKLNKAALVRGALLEIAGRRAEALVVFQALARYLAKQPGTYQDAVGAEVKRLSGQ